VGSCIRPFKKQIWSRYDVQDSIEILQLPQ
jgi:hypothetical protein